MRAETLDFSVRQDGDLSGCRRPPSRMGFSDPLRPYAIRGELQAMTTRDEILRRAANGPSPFPERESANQTDEISKLAREVGSFQYERTVPDAYPATAEEWAARRDGVFLNVLLALLQEVRELRKDLVGRSEP